MIHVYAYSVLDHVHVRVTCAEPVEETQSLKLLYSISTTAPSFGSPAGSADELYALAQIIFDAAAELHAEAEHR